MATRIGAFNIRELENFFVPILQNCKNIVELKSIHARVIKYSLSQSNFLVTKMVDVCDKSEDLGYASLLFNQVKEPNGYLYNAMIRAYTHNEGYTSAILFYKEMLRLKDPERENPIFPDRFTFPFVIKSCSGLVCYNLGKQIHAHLCKFGPKSNITMENALIDMYTKCESLLGAHKVFEGMVERDAISWNSIISGHVGVGQMRKARALFDSMPYRTIVSWTAMISGYTRFGSYADAVDVFRQMQIVGVEPDEINLGKWDGVSRMRKLIKSKSMKKTPGSSLIDINNVVQEFVSWDDSKPFSRDIFWLLEVLTSHRDTTDPRIIEIMPEDGSECLG
ncbi:hypothetical protein OIU74_025201 [Salix koriyanagi]|uniref:Pentatricopeptide repeat-containing protein n=1 Tax=Salix koriyanagi TaxID=2511006 RepID=A0A9Q0W1V6_9ROSI|nr:hypothetical protein OIU74_025201 [Salix koriyanagi]